MNIQGIWNEVNIDAQGKWITDRVMPLGPDWVAYVKLLRRTLNKYGLQDVKIVVGEQVSIWEVVQLVHDDPELRDAVHAIGVHYPGWLSPDAAKKIGKPIWDSEDGPWRGDWEGACSLAKIYNRNYISGRMTSTQNWSPITSYYDALEIPGTGLMKANTPWSGHYEVQPAIWAVAHTAQFTKPGWKYIDSGCGLLNSAGSYLTLKSPDGKDYSIIIETMGWPNPYPTHARRLRFKLKGLSGRTVHVWQTTEGAQFVKKDDIVPVDGLFEITVEGFSIYTLSTTTGQGKGSTTILADSARFPFPYKEDFEGYGLDKQPKYFSDQNGTFAVAERADGKGRCLRQMSPRKGIEWVQHYEFPWSVVGDQWWGDYEVSADVCVGKAGLARVYGRIDAPNVSRATPIPGGYCLSLDRDGAWQLAVKSTILSSGKVDVAPDSWHSLKLRLNGGSITAMIDGRQVASVTDSTHRTGMAGLGSSFSYVDFDNFSVGPIAPEQ